MSEPEPFSITIKRPALKQIARLSSQVRPRVVSAIESLAAEPRPSGVVKLQGDDDYYRIRVGDYRVLYKIDDAGHVVIVTIVGHRSEVYR